MLPLFFVPSLGTGDVIEVGGHEAHHAIKVLRTEEGEEIMLADGSGAWVRGKVAHVGKQSFKVEVVERGIQEPLVPELIVIQALMKSDRAKEAIELLTVAGASTIIPWQSARSIAKWQDDVGEKWLTTSITAAKQSRRLILPIIEGPITTAQIAKRYAGTANLVILHEGAIVKLSEVAKDFVDGPVVLVIGPEGGLTGEELGELSAAGGKITLLGSEVLRSAHAGFAALSAISALIGRW
jgi:16S rRNA (uracil1498-N3)-methyltransferase